MRAFLIVTGVIFGLIVVSYVASRMGEYHVESICVGLLVIAMAIAVVHGVLRLRSMQADYDVRCPPKPPK